MDSDDIKSCTVVFRLAKGPQVVPLDFAPHLDIVAGRIRGFGTVGVGHIWHLTLTSQCYVDDLITQGDFVLRGRAVAVSKLGTALLSATLFWLPFWVAHEDVITSFGELLQDKVTCEYVRIDQKGFPGCYSTQRRITAATDLKALPHFLSIQSEGHTYRTFLFVPGRPPACFACNAIGHMKSSCPLTIDHSNTTSDVPAPAGQPDLPAEEEISHEGTPSSRQSPKSTHSEALEEASLEAASQHRYHILEKQANKFGRSTPKKHKGHEIRVVPPQQTFDVAAFEIESARCTRTFCAVINSFRKERVAAQDMERHIDACHLFALRLERC